MSYFIPQSQCDLLNAQNLSSSDSDNFVVQTCKVSSESTPILDWESEYDQMCHIYPQADVVDEFIIVPTDDIDPPNPLQRVKLSGAESVLNEGYANIRAAHNSKSVMIPLNHPDEEEQILIENNHTLATIFKFSQLYTQGFSIQPRSHTYSSVYRPNEVKHRTMSLIDVQNKLSAIYDRWEIPYANLPTRVDSVIHATSSLQELLAYYYSVFGTSDAPYYTSWLYEQYIRSMTVASEATFRLNIGRGVYSLQISKLTGLISLDKPELRRLEQIDLNVYKYLFALQCIHEETDHTLAYAMLPGNNNGYLMYTTTIMSSFGPFHFDVPITSMNSAIDYANATAVNKLTVNQQRHNRYTDGSVATETVQEVMEMRLNYLLRFNKSYIIPINCSGGDCGVCATCLPGSLTSTSSFICGSNWINASDDIMESALVSLAQSGHLVWDSQVSKFLVETICKMINTRTRPSHRIPVLAYEALRRVTITMDRMCVNACCHAKTAISSAGDFAQWSVDQIRNFFERFCLLMPNKHFLNRTVSELRHTMKTWVEIRVDQIVKSLTCLFIKTETVSEDIELQVLDINNPGLIFDNLELEAIVEEAKTKNCNPLQLFRSVWESISASMTWAGIRAAAGDVAATIYDLIKSAWGMAKAVLRSIEARLGPCLTRLFIYGFYMYGVHLCSQYSMPAAIIVGVIGSIVAYNDIRDLALSTLSCFTSFGNSVNPQMDLVGASTNIFKSILGLSIPTFIAAESVVLLRNFITLVQAGKSIGTVMDALVRFITTPYNYVMAIYDYRSSDMYKDVRRLVDILEKTSIRDILSVAQAATFLDHVETLRSIRFVYGRREKQDYVLRIIDDIVYRSNAVAEHCRSMLQGAEASTPSLAISLFGPAGTGKSTAVNSVASAIYDGFITCPIKLKQDDRFVPNTTLSPAAVTPLRLAPYMDNVRPGIVSVIDDCMNTTVVSEITAKYDSLVNMISPAQTPLNVADLTQKNKTFYVSEATILTSNTPLNAAQTNLAERNAPLRRIVVNANLTLGPNREPLYTIMRFYGINRNDGSEIITLDENNFMHYIKWLASNHENIFNPSLRDKNTKPSNPRSREVVVNSEFDAFCAQIFTDSTGNCYPIHYPGQQYRLPEHVPHSAYTPPQLQYCSLLEQAGRFEVDNTFFMIDNPRQHALSRAVASIPTWTLVAAASVMAAGCLYWAYKKLVVGIDDDVNVDLPQPPQAITLFHNDTTTELFEQKGRIARGYGSDEHGYKEDNPYVDKLRRRYEEQGCQEKPSQLEQVASRVGDVMSTAATVALYSASALAAMKGVEHVVGKLTAEDEELPYIAPQNNLNVELRSFDDRVRSHMVRFTTSGGQVSTGCALALDQHTLIVPSHYMDHWDHNTGISINGQYFSKSSVQVCAAKPTSYSEQPHYNIVLCSQAVHGITNISADIAVNSNWIDSKITEVRRMNAINKGIEVGLLPYGFVPRDCGDVIGVEVRLAGDNGMCGSIYTVVQGGIPKIIGFHTHGTQRGAKKPVSIITPLHLEEIMSTVDSLKGRVKQVPNLLVVSGDGVPKSHRKNEITRTPLYGVLAPSSRHPIDLRSPIVSEVSLGGIGNALGTVPITILKIAIAHTRSMLGVVVGHTLTLSESINGNGALGIKPMDLSTSAGLGFTGNKNDYIVGEPGLYRLLPHLEQEFYQYEHSPVESRIGMAMKSELRSEEKIKAHKARMFCYPDLYYTILGRKLTGHLFAKIAQDPVRQEISVGINPHSSDWAELANVFADQMVIDGDMSSFDNTIPLCIMDAAFDIVKSRCPYMTEAEVSRLKSSTFYPTIEYNGLIMKKIGGNTSGGVATAGINSICLLLLLKCAVQTLIMEKELEATLNDFNFRAYGDDSLIGVPKHLSKDITPVELGRVLGNFGCKYTSADKSDLKAETNTTIHDVTYLKRRFVCDGDKYNWSAPLPIDVITDIPNYFSQVPKSLTEARDIVTSMFDSVSVELAHHPEDVFYKHTSQLRAAIQDVYTINLLKPDYKVIRSNMRHMGLVPQSLVLEDQNDPVIAEDTTTETYSVAQPALRYKEDTQPILERSFHVSSFQINSTSSESLAVVDLANIIRANPYLMGVFNRYGATRFKMRFTCTASVNSTLSALMRCTYYPGVIPTAAYNRTFAHVWSEESYLFNIADRQLVFNVECKTNLDNSWYIQSTSFSLGSMLFSLESGIAGSTVGSEKVQISIYAALYDVEVSMPVAQMDKETAVKSETGLASTLITGAAGFIDKLPVPGASKVAQATKIIGSVAKFLGFQCPNSGKIADKTISVAHDGLSNSRSVFLAQTYSFSATKTIRNDPKLAMTTERPLISEIVQQPGLVASGSFTSTSSKLFSLQMCPQGQRYDLSGAYAPTKLHYISRFAGSYYGDVNCQVLFNCSPMVSCEVLLVHTIGDPGAADYISNPDASISERFFIQGPTEVSVRIPYIGNRSRSSTTECANGFLTAYLITAPVASTTAISTQINYTVYTGAADNMILAEPTDFAGVFPQSIKPKPIRSGNFIKNFLSSEFVYLRDAITYDPTLIEGEMLESYQDLFLRPESPKTMVASGGLYRLVTSNPFSKMFLRHRNGFRVTAWIEEGATGTYTVELVVLGRTRGRVLWNCSITPVLSLNISRPLLTVYDVVANNFPVDPWQAAQPVYLRVLPPVTGTLKAVVTYSDDTSLGGFIYPSSLVP